MDDTAAARIVDLEIKLAFQENLVHELDQFVRALSTRLEIAEQVILEMKQASGSPGLTVGPADETPPHY